MPASPTRPSRGRPFTRNKRHVIRRDGGICHICGQPGADSADHIIPRSHGGTDAASNLRAVHHDVEPKCNRIRGNGTITAAQAKLAGPDPGITW